MGFYPNQERFGVGAKHYSLCDEATLPDTEHLMRTVSKMMNYFHQKLGVFKVQIRYEAELNMILS